MEHSYSDVLELYYKPNGGLEVVWLHPQYLTINHSYYREFSNYHFEVKNDRNRIYIYVTQIEGIKIIKHP